MYRANVDGTRELLRLAREAHVKRFVYTSSVATMHFRTDGIVINEDTPVSLADMVGHYKRSKFLAEQEAIKAAENGQQVIILNPTTPIGPNDRKPTPTGRIFVDFLNGKFPAYMDTGLNLVDVSEVARAHVLALTKGTPGRRYILGGENLTLKQILDKMSAITGIPSPTVKIPFAVAATYAFFEEMDHRPHSRQRAARHARRGPHGPQENVRLKRARPAGARLPRSCLSIQPCAPRSTGSAPTATRPPTTRRLAPKHNHDPRRHHRRLSRRAQAARPQLAAQRRATARASGPSAPKKKNGSPPAPAPANPPQRAPSPRSKRAVPSIWFSPSAGPERFAPRSPPARHTT